MYLKGMISSEFAIVLENLVAAYNNKSDTRDATPLDDIFEPQAETNKARLCGLAPVLQGSRVLMETYPISDGGSLQMYNLVSCDTSHKVCVRLDGYSHRLL